MIVCDKCKKETNEEYIVIGLPVKPFERSEDGRILLNQTHLCTGCAVKVKAFVDKSDAE